MTDTFVAGSASTTQLDPTRFDALRESLETLFGENPDRGALQTLHLVATNDPTRAIIYILVSPHGLTADQWEEVLQEAFSLFVGVEAGRIDHDLSEFSEEEIAAYDADNLRGLIVLVGARKGWTVMPVQGAAWGQTALEI